MLLQTSNALLGFLENPFFLISLAFWVAIALLVVILGRLGKAKALSIFFPFIAMVKTTRLNRFLKRVARISPRAWKIIWTIGIFVSFAFMIYGFYYFSSNLLVLASNWILGKKPPATSQIAPLVPGLTISFNTFLYLIIPILFVLTTHEFAHAISANADNIPVKTTGVLGMGVFFIIGFGAFVEIDDKAYRRGPYTGWARARLAAAGSFTNAFLSIFGLLIVLNFAAVVSPVWGHVNGYQVQSVYTAAQGGHDQGILQVGDIIHSVNGTQLTSQFDISTYIHDYVPPTNVSKNSMLVCIVQRGGTNITVTVITGPQPSGVNSTTPFIGITAEAWWPPRGGFGQWLGGTFPNTLETEFFWFYLISISVTIFNMMPLPIFDGDKLVYEVLEFFIKPKTEKKTFHDKFSVGKTSKTIEMNEPRGSRIESITSIKLLRNGQDTIETPAIQLVEHQDYQIVDSKGDGYIDHISFEIRDLEFSKGDVIAIDYDAQDDSRRHKRSIIMNVIRIVALAIIIGNFVISGITLGFGLPFTG
jgi:membrane-associated protease RseP (regulator of RpoE activity)